MHAQKLLWIALLLLPSSLAAQENRTSQFGCSQPDERTQFDPRPNLRFLEFTAASAINAWKLRPMVAFEGFDAGKYGFTRAEFYRWHVPVPARQGFDQSPHGDSTDRLALAIRILSSQGEHWFELASPASAEEMLYIQPLDSLGDQQESQEDSPLTSDSQDEMAKWLRLAPATPDAKRPLFSLIYGNNDSGMYQAETFTRKWLLDLSGGTPQVVKTVSCDSFEATSGACSAQDTAYAATDHLDCRWEARSNDFHCILSVPYGSAAAEREFLLLADKPIQPANLLPGLAEFTAAIEKNPQAATAATVVAGLGPTAVVQRIHDLLPGKEVLVFASPNGNDPLDVRLAAAIVSSSGPPGVEAIPKWHIGGEALNDKQAPAGFLPAGSHVTYRSRILARQPGFRAFTLVLTSGSGPDAIHVVYWVGLEAVNGKLVSNAVRLASDAYSYRGCGDEYHESTATLLKQKPGTAEATVRVQGPFNYEYQTRKYPTDEGNCVWSGLLRWKEGAGFRVRKTAQDCRASHLEVQLSEDGQIHPGLPPK